MKILFICYQLPFPLLKGYQARAFSQLHELSQHHEVDLVCLEFGKPKLEDIRKIETIVNSLKIVKHSFADMAKNVWKVILSGKPIQTSLYRNSQLNSTIQDMTQIKKYDIVHVQMVRMAEVLPSLQGLPIVLDLIDALSKNMRLRSTLDKWPLNLIFRLESFRLQKFERHLTQALSSTLVVSESDSVSIGGNRPPHVVPLGVNTERFRFRTYQGRKGLIFCGNLSYFPNHTTALHLLNHIMPLVWKVDPHIRLTLAGANPSEELVRAAANKPVEITGFVEDLSQYIGEAAVAVFPMQTGSGMQYKVLEAMSVGTPVITSSIAAGAFKDFIPDIYGIIADDVQSTVNAILRVLNDQSIGGQMASRARTWIEDNYSWSASVKQLTDEYERVLNS